MAKRSKTKKRPKIIKIGCKASDVVNISRLVHFQGNLKTLDKNRAAKIQASIEKYGFTFPIFVWKSKKEKSFKIIDGHQRVFVVKAMLQDGWKIKNNSLPVCFIDAKTKKEAKEKVLLAASVYGRVDDGGMHDFINEAGIEIEDVASMIDIPDISLDIDVENPRQPDFDENIETKNECPKCGYSW